MTASCEPMPWMTCKQEALSAMLMSTAALDMATASPQAHSYINWLE